MALHLRLLVLISLARLRGAGLLPWVAFLAWVAIAASQEPVMLRNYGVHLLDEACWAAGVLLLALLLLAEARLPKRLGWLANLVVLAVVATAQVLPPLVTDLLQGRACPAGWYLGMPAFLVCWAPLSLAHSALVHCPRMPTLLLVAVAFVLGGAHSVALRSPDPFHGLLSAAMAIAACAAWTKLNISSCHK